MFAQRAFVRKKVNYLIYTWRIELISENYNKAKALRILNVSFARNIRTYTILNN